MAPGLDLSHLPLAQQKVEKRTVYEVLHGHIWSPGMSGMSHTFQDVRHVKSCVCCSHIIENCSHIIFAWIAARTLRSKTADARLLVQQRQGHRRAEHSSPTGHSHCVFGRWTIHLQNPIPVTFSKKSYSYIVVLQAWLTLWRQDEQLLWIAEHAMNAEPQSLAKFDGNCENRWFFTHFVTINSYCMLL